MRTQVFESALGPKLGVLMPVEQVVPKVNCIRMRVPGVVIAYQSAKTAGPALGSPGTSRPLQEVSRPLMTWGNWREACRVMAYGPHLRRTALVALAVGTVLFAINHLDEVLRGHATRVIWVKGAVTYLVPFCVSNIGVLVGTRRPRER